MVKVFYVTGNAKVQPFRFAAASIKDAFLRGKEVGLLPQDLSQESWRDLPKTVKAHECLDEFFSRYQPLNNHLDRYAALEGHWFETFGVQEAYVRRTPSSRIWTIVEDDDLIWLIAGFHIVNRLGYVLTRTPWKNPFEAYVYV